MALQAGAARRDISPTKPMQLYGYPHVKRISTGTHDPLYASALVLSDNGDSVVHIALDILMLNPAQARQIRDAVATALGVVPAAVMMSCTHTHSAPVTTKLVSFDGNVAMPEVDESYIHYLQVQIVEAAVAAKAASRPAAIAWTTANGKGVGGYRLSADGPTDSEVGVLAVRDLQAGSLMSVVTFYGMHPTVMHEDSTLVSSDFIYYTRAHLEEEHGDDLVVVYHTAPCGNQSPRNFVTGQTFAEAERLGRKLGQAVKESLAQLTDSSFATTAKLKSLLQAIDLPRRTIPPLAEAEATLVEYQATFDRLKAENAGHSPVRTAECAVFGAQGSLALAKAKAKGTLDQALDAFYTLIELQAHQIGDVTVLGWPGECFVEYALEFKQKAPCKTFLAAFVNGELQGYIVTPEAAAAGGYEATNAAFAPESGRVFIEQSLAMLDTLNQQ